ncbi:DUF2628 domain-containing protein [Rhodopila sp.]|uniref:DUF2628 domain-containing protein n=1 Tax=Rhodopila sp. TaxID=2480087 RepID=UPI002CCEBA74|nr:DUF2628 domain-containing protein [Rhodopila sp.]HVZ07682.1 DUF2628 domain-containing protein [Rhodopila sp.]
MRLYAVHVKPDAEPVLMSEGFAWASFFLGPLWLASQRAWIPAAFSLLAYVVVLLWLPAAWGVAAACGIALLLGLNGHDMQGWALDHRGYVVAHVVAGRDRDDAWMRLLTHRPDLVARLGVGVP